MTALVWRFCRYCGTGREDLRLVDLVAEGHRSWDVGVGLWAVPGGERLHAPGRRARRRRGGRLMRCRYCGTGERPVRLVTVLAENSGPGIDVYACTSCRAANDLTPVDEPPSGPDGAERTGRREVCVWCRRTTHAPVVARVLEPSGHTLYQYHGCAWKRCLDHIAECRECHAIGGKCPRALAMWRAISESRARYLTL